MPNKIFQFWQELKRRNVVRVITVYAGAAFVIIELINNITEPLRLPEWTPTLVIVLLAIGFPIVIIFSWIYEVHPEGGMVKTEPDDQVMPEGELKSSNSWKIASYISFLVIVGLIVLNIMTRSGNKEILDKSIAVLPFRNDSPEQTEMYFIDGTMESILDNLCKIQDLRVVSRTSVEQYRNNPKPIPTVGEEMNVSYVVEGSGLRHGDNIRLTIQLIDAIHDQHIWSHTYNRKTSEIFDLQSEIAQLVASEIEAVITPEEKQIIESTPTTNIRALSLYRKAREEYLNYWLNRDNPEMLHAAMANYRLALKEDQTFAQAYAGLALAISRFIQDESMRNREFRELEYSVYLDSVLFLADRAISYDPNLDEAYLVKGYYHIAIQDYDRALQEFDKALRINPNYSWAYSAKSDVLFSQKHNWIEGLNSKFRAIELERGNQQIRLLRELGMCYEHMGFNDKAEEVYNHMLLLTGDSVLYHRYMAAIAYCNRDWEERIYRCKKLLDAGQFLNWSIGELCNSYLLIGNIDSAYYYALRLLETGGRSVYSGDPELYIARTFMKIGRKEEALQMLEKYATERIQLIPLDGLDRDSQLLTMSGVCYIKGDYEESIAYLRQIDLSTVKPQWFIIEMEKIEPPDGISAKKEYQLISNKIKSVWQEEHNKMAVWLEENEML